MATQKVHFFTGKGGVGKSVITAAYALAASSAKSSQILLTELSDESTFNDVFQSKRLPSNLNVTHWNAQSCLEEYATSLLRSTTLSKLFLNNVISKSLIHVAPGLQELALLGKATSTPRKHGPPMNYDEIFIDAFASGHFLSLMSTPQSFAEVFTFGPMASQSRSIDEWIKNSDFASVHIVTMAEDLSLQESAELYRSLSDMKIKSDFILNKFVQTENINFKKLPEKTRSFFERIHESQTFTLSELNKFKVPIKKIHYAFENDLHKILQKVAHEI